MGFVIFFVHILAVHRLLCPVPVLAQAMQGGFAAQMIDEAGLKGRRVGGAMVSEKHAGFLVNAGGATAADMLALMLLVQQTVQQRTGVTLEPEVRFVGREMENSHVLYK